MRPLPHPDTRRALQVQRLAGGLLGAVVSGSLTSRLPEVTAIAVPGWLLHRLARPPQRAPRPQPDAER